MHPCWSGALHLPLFCRNLSGNPFECDCALAWLPHWAKERQVHVLQSEAATCRGPIPLAGQSLFNIPLLDNACGEYRE